MMSHPCDRQGSVYLAILVVVTAVTSLVLTGVTLRKHLHERASLGGDASAVRRLAISGAELVVHAAAADEVEFRKQAGSGLLFDGLSLAPGFISASVLDADTKSTVTPTTKNFRVLTTATVGDTTSRLSMLLDTPDDALSILMSSMPTAIAYWPLEEVNQPVGTDEIASRHANYAVPVAAGAYTHVHGGPAPRITWMTEFVRVPHASAFELSDGTLTLWVRFDLKPTMPGQQMAVVAKERSPAGLAINLAVYLEHDYVYYMLNNSLNRGGSIRFPSSAIQQGKWHFMAITWGNAGMEIYLDGVRMARDTGIRVDLNQVLLSRPVNNYDWYFGVRNIPFSTYSQSNPIFGSVARVSLFNTQISPAQITSVYQADSLPPGIRPVRGGYATAAD